MEVAVPSALISNTLGSLPDQLGTPLYAAPYWSAIVAVKVTVSAKWVNATEDGDTEILVGMGGSGSGGVPESPQAAISTAIRGTTHDGSGGGPTVATTARSTPGGPVRFHCLGQPGRVHPARAVPQSIPSIGGAMRRVAGRRC